MFPKRLLNKLLGVQTPYQSARVIVKCYEKLVAIFGSSEINTQVPFILSIYEKVSPLSVPWNRYKIIVRL